MKVQPSTRHQSSTLPTISDSSFNRPEDKSLSHTALPSLLLKIQQLQSALIRANRQKTTLLQQQQKLQIVLQQKLQTVSSILKEREICHQSKLYYQPSLQSEIQWHPLSFGMSQHRPSQFRPQKTQRRCFYSALNSPRQLSEQRCSLTNSRTESLKKDQDANQVSAFAMGGQQEARVPQDSLKTSKIRKQTINSYLSHGKYKNIDQIWNEGGSQLKVACCKLRHSYL